MSNRECLPKERNKKNPKRIPLIHCGKISESETKKLKLREGRAVDLGKLPPSKNQPLSSGCRMELAPTCFNRFGNFRIIHREHFFKQSIREKCLSFLLGKISSFSQRSLFNANTELGFKLSYYYVGFKFLV